MAGMQADMKLEKNLRVLHLYPKAARKNLSNMDLIGGSNSKNFKPHPHSDAPPPTRLHHHLMPLT